MASTLCLLALIVQIVAVNGYSSPVCYGHRVSLQNGFYQRVRGNLEIEAFCNDGFELNGDNRRFCDNDLQSYTGSDPSCDDIDECQLLTEGSGDNGWPEDMKACDENAFCDNTPGSYRCTCNQGYYGDGHSCKELTCKIPKIENGHVSVNGRVLTVTCDDHFNRAGAGSLFCPTPSKNWSKKLPECRPESTCSTPRPLINGRMTFSRRKPYVTGTVVSFYCNEGYMQEGAFRMECQDDTTWTNRNNQPSCTESGMNGMANRLNDDIDTWSSFEKNNTSDSNTGARFSIHQHDGIDIIYVMDGSSSVTNSRFQLGIDFVSAITREIKAANTTGIVRVAAITYSDSPTVNFKFEDSVNWDIATLEQKLNALKPKQGGTNCPAAFLVGANRLLKKSKTNSGAKPKRVVFLITDGQDNAGLKTTCHESAAKLKAKRAEVYVIGIGSSVNEEELRKVASYPYQKHLFLLESHDDLQKLKDLIIDRRQEHHKCGLAGDIDGAVNHTATIDAWPWYANIEIPSEDFRVCGATLICRTWVITSAKCITKSNGNIVAAGEIKVKLGLSGLPEGNREMAVGHVVRHPNYNQENKHENDIALLELKGQVPLGKSIQVVCLPKRDGTLAKSGYIWRPSTKVYLTGFGISDADITQTSFMTLHQLNATILEDQPCSDTLKLADLEPGDKMSCIGSGEEATTEKECLGDIGGSVVASDTLYSKKFFNLVGITTFNSHCNKYQKYTVMTKTLPYLEWIEDITGDCNRRYNCRDINDVKCKKEVEDEL